MTGLVVGILVLIRSIIALIFSDPQLRWVGLWIFVEIGILFVLAFGIRRNNRVCAVLLPVYFIYLLIRKAEFWNQSGVVPPGILTDLIALALCLHGTRGTFALHKIRQNA